MAVVVRTSVASARCRLVLIMHRAAATTPHDIMPDRHADSDVASSSVALTALHSHTWVLLSADVSAQCAAMANPQLVQAANPAGLSKSPAMPLMPA